MNSRYRAYLKPESLFSKYRDTNCFDEHNKVFRQNRQIPSRPGRPVFQQQLPRLAKPRTVSVHLHSK